MSPMLLVKNCYVLVFNTLAMVGLLPRLKFINMLFLSDKLSKRWVMDMSLSLTCYWDMY